MTVESHSDKDLAMTHDQKAEVSETDCDSKHVDKALIFANNHERVNLTEAENKRILRKIDLHILPMMCGLYCLQYLDKTTLSYASIMGLQEDTHITSDQYAWTGSIFYAGYLVFEYPHNIMFQKFSMSKYLSICVVLWGAVLCSMAACTNFASLMVVRTILGALEGSVTPAFVLVTARWYRQQEQISRIGVWFTMNGVSQILGGAIVFGIAQGIKENPNTSLAGWKIIFVLTGLLTSVYGIGMWFVPDNILEAKWLNEHDKALAIERLRINQEGMGNRTWKWHQFREAMLDIRTWLLFFHTTFACLPNGGIVTFFAILIRGYGFTTTETLLLAMPGGAWQILIALALCWIASWSGKRHLMSIVAYLFAIFGAALMAGLPTAEDPTRHRIAQLVGYYIAIGSPPASFIMVLSLISTNTLGYTKKVTVNAMTMVGYCVGFLLGPQLFRDPPYYHKAKIYVVAIWIAALITIILLYLVNWTANKRKDRKLAENPEEPVAGHEFMDLTDKENKFFRYAL